jgi:hypothetical protein
MATIVILPYLQSVPTELQKVPFLGGNPKVAILPTFKLGELAVSGAYEEHDGLEVRCKMDQ